MADYTYRDPLTGLILKSPVPLQPADLQEAFQEMRKQAPIAPLSAATAPLPTAEEVPEDTLLGKIGSGLGTAFTSTVEAMGRPQEALMGYLTGAMTGGHEEGQRRAKAAFFEPRFADSKIEERFQKVLQAGDILSGSPALQAGAGFLGDVFLDPMNLAGGAGILRKGIIGGAAKLGGLVGKAEEARKLARAATLVPMGEAIQAKAKPVVQAGLELVGAKLPTKYLMRAPALAGMRGTSGRLASETLGLSEGRMRAAESVVSARVNKVLEGLSPEQQRSVMLAVGDPTAPLMPGSRRTIGEAVESSPELGPIKRNVEKLLEATYQSDVRRGVMPAKMELETGRFSAQLDQLTPASRANLQQALKAGSSAGLTADETALYNKLVATVSRRTPDGRIVQLYDPTTITLEMRKGQPLVARVSTRGVNYLPSYLQKETEPTINVFRQYRTSLPESAEKTKSLASHLQDPEAVTDLNEMLQRRMVSSLRAQESADMLGRFATDFGQPAASAPADFVSFSDKFVKSLPEGIQGSLRETKFPKAVVDELERVIVRVNDPNAMEGLLRRGGKYFKALVTSMNIPSYHFTNFVGNVANMYAAGMDPDDIFREYTRANKVMRQTGTLDSVSFGKARLNHDMIMEAATRNGVIGDVSGYASEFKREQPLTTAAQKLMGEGTPLNPENVVFKTVQATGQRWVEDPAKLAMFYHELKQGAAKGLTPRAALEAAVIKAKNTMFDYGALSEFERKMAPYALFYTYFRKNIPFQLETLLTTPARLSHQARLVNLPSQMAGAPEDWKSEVPSYVREGRFVVPGMRTEGGQPILAASRLPMYDLAQISNLLQNPAGLGRFLQPGVRIPLELITGQEITETGTRPIYTGVGAATPLGRAMGLAIPGSRGTADEVQSNLSRYLTGQVPMPTALRALLAPRGDMDEMSLAQRVPLALAGTQPQVVDALMLKRARDQRVREERARRRRLQEAQRLEAGQPRVPFPKR